jgi:hypothetical protein
MDQSFAQSRFEALDGLRDGGPGETKVGGRGGEGSGVGDFGEDRPGFKVREGHGRPSNGNDDFPSFRFSLLPSSPIFGLTNEAKARIWKQESSS